MNFEKILHLIYIGRKYCCAQNNIHKNYKTQKQIDP